MRFRKYHALGNDYIVMGPIVTGPREEGWEPTRELVRTICHRNYGLGSDGILWGAESAPGEPFGLRIFNPDGSEAEMSGNGVRIFARYLADAQRVGTGEAFRIETRGGVVTAVVCDGGRRVEVDMGRVSFASEAIPVVGWPRDVVNERMTIDGRELAFTAATIGNPHCVIVLDEMSEAVARRLGPAIETHQNFPRRTNVQFMRVRDRGNIEIEIWERGAGYTLASGSSSCAAAAVAHRLGMVDRAVTVHMPGGEIGIEIGEGYAVRMSGPVTRVADGELHAEAFGCGIDSKALY
ncbi:diaminopimelate epimerase [Oleiharenicola sp. Vm1]|uniref:diaminopimelate epimerase n=1 Tax=Oleiharenicola sp. Vm1 TaxID=3398393 RepID=UPI0039F52335